VLRALVVSAWTSSGLRAIKENEGDVGVLPMGANRNRRRSGNERSRTQREMKKLGGKKPRPAGLFSRAAAWFAAHVLPGFLMASVPALETAVSRHSALKVLDSKAFGLHFAATLRIWRERFQAQARQIEFLGFDDAFRRTWLFFLVSSEASFQTGLCDVHQYILARD
jgi:cyclopropane fatty-acyl-phospholipid synthase-like methyltransferase